MRSGIWTIGSSPQWRRKRASSADGGRAVDIVVAEDRDALAARSTASAMRAAAACHVGQHMRIGHQPLEGRIEKGLDLVRLDAAAGEDAREQFRHAVALRDGERARLPALVEPVAPGAAGRRASRRRGRSARRLASDHGRLLPARCHASVIPILQPLLARRNRGRVAGSSVQMELLELPVLGDASGAPCR